MPWHLGDVGCLAQNGTCGKCLCRLCAEPCGGGRSRTASDRRKSQDSKKRHRLTAYRLGDQRSVCAWSFASPPRSTRRQRSLSLISQVRVCSCRPAGELLSWSVWPII